MAENLIIEGSTKEEKYANLFPQIKSVLSAERDMIANMANVCSMLHETFNFFWTGFYRVIDGELVLSPFQGPLACTRIKKGRGVCGTAWQEEKTLIVPDVDKFDGHIACSSLSKSEIVVPVFRNKEIFAVLDIDSKELNTFDDTDKQWLEKIVALFDIE
ncbi:MAG: GAF domain-containing protein [Bacteroidales bacterium]|nr:GAF domain-containing protein [Bacteroidales bacterium]